MKKTMAFAVFLILGSSSFAWADGNGALTGAAGGAVTGAVVGGPVGAVVGGAAGAVIGGVATGPDRTVVVQPAPAIGAPCATQTTQTTDMAGNTNTTQTSNCPP